MNDNNKFIYTVDTVYIPKEGGWRSMIVDRSHFYCSICGELCKTCEDAVESFVMWADDLGIPRDRYKIRERVGVRHYEVPE